MTDDCQNLGLISKGSINFLINTIRYCFIHFQFINSDDRLIDWFYQHFNQSKAISCQVVWESYSLYLYINFVLLFLQVFFVRLWHQVFQSITNNLNTLTVFGLLSSSLLFFLQRFGRYVLRTSSSVCRTWEPSQNFELRPLLNTRRSPVLIPSAITGYKG